jgi:hypothetical protein
MLRRTLPILLATAVVAACGGAGPRGTSCGGGAMANLSLWHEARQFGAAFTLGHAAPRAPWRLVVVHEGRVDWRGDVRTDSRGGLKVLRRLDELNGADRVTVRATGPDGRTCAATATLN